MVGLAGTRHLMPTQLSGGMRKRVGLARSLVTEPDIILYDEPTTGLDPVTAHIIDQLIVDMRAKLGVTSVVVSHARRTDSILSGRRACFPTWRRSGVASGGPRVT